MRYVRMVRSVMLRSLSGPMLAQALDGFEYGDLRAAAQLWQSMAARDDVIPNVKGKREKRVSRRDWQVLKIDESAEAERQRKVLHDFWSNIKAVDAFDRNVRGGFAMLVRQMMQSVSFKYQAHHLVWQPSKDRLGCTFEAVPLQFFENRTGVLQFCPTGMEYEGTPMSPDEWMVTCGDGLMVAGSIGYFCKRNSMADWLAFSDKFGMPGILGRTNQGKDTEGGREMAEAVAAFGQDWATVIYGDDGSGKIELIEAKGGTSLPMPPLIERVDRRLTALWCGADLSSMSSTNGQGTGASIQGEESDLLEQDDALTISERLNEIDEIVLRWWFGPRVKVKAYVRLIVPQSEDLKLLLEVVEKLVRLGAPIAVADILERFGFATPKAGADLLGNVQAAREEDEAAREARLNAARDEAEEQFMARAARLLARASREDRENLVGGIKDILKAPEGRQLQELAAFVERLPANIGRDAAQVRQWEVLLASALVNGWSADSADDTE